MRFRILGLKFANLEPSYWVFGFDRLFLHGKNLDLRRVTLCYKEKYGYYNNIKYFIPRWLKLQP